MEPIAALDAGVLQRANRFHAGFPGASLAEMAVVGDFDAKQRQG